MPQTSDYSLFASRSRAAYKMAIGLWLGSGCATTGRAMLYNNIEEGGAQPRPPQRPPPPPLSISAVIISSRDVAAILLSRLNYYGQSERKFGRNVFRSRTRKGDITGPVLSPSVSAGL